MTARELLDHLLAHRKRLHDVAASFPVDPAYVRGYQRAVADAQDVLAKADTPEQAS